MEYNEKRFDFALRLFSVINNFNLGQKRHHLVHFHFIPSLLLVSEFYSKSYSTKTYFYSKLGLMPFSSLL